MATFVDDVFSAFGELEKRCGFIRAYAFSGTGSATLFKKLSEDVFLYLFVRDGRPSNAELSINMWIAPPHEPGDGLDKLYVGFKFLIAAAFDVDDDFFRLSEQRILCLHAHIVCLSDIVLHELATPAFRTQRYKAYLMERAAFRALHRSNHAQADMELFTKVARDKRTSFDSLEKIATQLAKQLIEDRKLSQDVAEFYGDDAVFLGRSLVGILYVHALTEKK